MLIIWVLIMKKVIALVIILILCLNISACSFIGVEGNAMLKAPKIVGEEASIQNLIETTVGTDYVFKYPQKGDYRSAIIIDDFTNDNTKETIAFYKLNDSSSGIFVMIMNNSNSEWKVIGSFENAYSEIDRIYILDMNNDGVKEIIVGWSSAGLAANKLTAYVFSENSVNEIKIDESYTDMLLTDLNGDEVEELFVVMLSATDSLPYAKLMKISELKDMIYASAIVDLSPDVNRILKLSYAPMSKNKKKTKQAVFLDGVGLDGEATTQVIYCDDNGNLLNPLFLNNKNDQASNEKKVIRTEKTLSQDINFDDIYEIPVENSLYDYIKHNADSEICNSFNWCVMNEKTKTLNVAMTTITDYHNNYHIKIPSSWQESYTAYYYPLTKSITVYYLNDSNLENVLVSPILTVRVFTRDEWEDFEKDNDAFFKIAENNDLVYTGTIYNNENSMINITKKQLIKNCIIF